MGPYRAPQPQPEKPRDAMRGVLIACGAAAGLIVLFALALAWTERREAIVAATPYRQQPGFSSFSYEIEEGLCLGDCTPFTASIDDRGLITRSGPSCPEIEPKRATDEERKQLAALAWALPLATLQPIYTASMTDVQVLHTTITVGAARYRFEHPRFGVPEAQALVDMHVAIAKAAHVDEWLAGCKSAKDGAL